MRADCSIRMPVIEVYGSAWLYRGSPTASDRFYGRGTRDQPHVGLCAARRWLFPSSGVAQALAQLPELRARPAELPLLAAERRRYALLTVQRCGGANAARAVTATSDTCGRALMRIVPGTVAALLALAVSWPPKRRSNAMLAPA